MLGIEEDAQRVVARGLGGDDPQLADRPLAHLQGHAVLLRTVDGLHMEVVVAAAKSEEAAAAVEGTADRRRGDELHGLATQGHVAVGEVGYQHAIELQCARHDQPVVRAGQAPGVGIQLRGPVTADLEGELLTFGQRLVADDRQQAELRPEVEALAGVQTLGRDDADQAAAGTQHGVAVEHDLAGRTQFDAARERARSGRVGREGQRAAGGLQLDRTAVRAQARADHLQVTRRRQQHPAAGTRLDTVRADIDGPIGRTDARCDLEPQLGCAQIQVVGRHRVGIEQRAEARAGHHGALGGDLGDHQIGRGLELCRTERLDRRAHRLQHRAGARGQGQCRRLDLCGSGQRQIGLRDQGQAAGRLHRAADGQRTAAGHTDLVGAGKREDRGRARQRECELAAGGLGGQRRGLDREALVCLADTGPGREVDPRPFDLRQAVQRQRTDDGARCAQAHRAAKAGDTRREQVARRRQMDVGCACVAGWQAGVRRHRAACGRRHLQRGVGGTDTGTGVEHQLRCREQTTAYEGA